MRRRNPFVAIAGLLAACGSEAAHPASDLADAGSDARDEPMSQEMDSGPPVCSPFVTNVVRVDYGAGAGFGRSAFPAVVEGPPKGGGCCKGSLNVLSLGDGGSIVVEFGQTIVDAPGADFIVFENPFDVGGDPQNPYADPATVSVSSDGVTWFAFPCSAGAYPWGACAGWHPVFANPDENAIDPLDPMRAGGDAFDLADLAADGGPMEAKYVRITDRADVAGDFDLDAIGVVHGQCR
jgi:hypothetical protein